MATLKAIHVHRDVVERSLLSAEGTTALIILKDGDGSALRRWDTATGKPAGPPLRPWWGDGLISLSAEFALTGNRANFQLVYENNVYKGLQQYNRVQLWDTATGRLIGKPLPDEHQLIALSDNGKIALTAGVNERMPRLWNTASANAIGPPALFKHSNRIVAVALSGDGKKAMTAETDTALVWDTSTGKPVGPALKMNGIEKVALSSDGMTAITANWDHVWIWKVPDGSLVSRMRHEFDANAMVRFCDFSLCRDGRTVLTVDGKGVGLWDINTGLAIWRQGDITRASMDASGKLALTETGDKSVRLLELPANKHVGRGWPVTAVAVSDNGKMALTGTPFNQSSIALRSVETQLGVDDFIDPSYLSSLSLALRSRETIIWSIS